MRIWVLLFVLVFAISLLWSAPARLLPRLLPDDSLQFSELSGRLWSGNAGQVAVQVSGQTLILDDVRWRMQWASLLRARLCLDVSSGTSSISDTSQREASAMLQGESCFSAGGVVQLSNTVFEFPAAQLLSARMANSPLLQTLNSGVQLQGQISGSLQNLLWQQGQLHHLEAVGVWSDAALLMQLPDAQTLRMTHQRLSLATVPWRAETTAPDQLFLQVGGDGQDNRGPVDLTLDSQSDIWLDGRYLTRLTLQLQDSTPKLLRDLLNIIAESDGNGTYRLVWRKA